MFQKGEIEGHGVPQQKKKKKYINEQKQMWRYYVTWLTDILVAC